MANKPRQLLCKKKRIKEHIFIWLGQDSEDSYQVRMANIFSRSYENVLVIHLLFSIIMSVVNHCKHIIN